MKPSTLVRKTAPIVLIFLFLTGCTQQQTQEYNFYEKGEEYLADKKYSAALVEFEKAANAEPSSEDAFLKIAEIYLLKGEREKAKEVLEQNEKGAARPSKIDEKLGDVYREDKDFKKAEEFYEKAYKGDENNWGLMLKRARNLIRLNKSGEALKILENYNGDDREGKSQVNFMLAMLTANDVDKALNYLNLAVETEDDDLEDKIESLRKILSLAKEQPNDVVENKTNIAYELVKNELPSLAIPYLKDVVEQNDEYWGAFLYLGTAYLKIDDYENAKNNLEKSISLNPTEIAPIQFLAQTYTRMEDQQHAEEYFEKALAVNSQDEKVRYDYAITLSSFGLYSKASEQYEELIKLQTSSWITYKIEVGSIYLDEIKAYEKAAALAEELIEEWQDFASADKQQKAEIYDIYGWALYKQEKRSDGMKAIEQSITYYPYLTSAHYHLGTIQIETSDYNAAKESLERAIDLDLEGKVGSEAKKELDKIT